MSSKDDHSTHPNDNNTVRVSLRCEDSSKPGELTLYDACGNKIDEIDMDPSKKFIFFDFPENYSDFDIRIFEPSEQSQKDHIMSTYADDKTQGLTDFGEKWGGWPSSGGKDGEFRLRSPDGTTMRLRDKEDDFNLHGYILKFTVDGTTYLQDPSIRNIEA